MKAKFFLLLNLFVCLVLSTASAAEKHDLRYHLKMGDAYAIKNTQVIDATTSLMGNEIPMRLTSHLDLRMRVTDVDAQGNTTAIFTYEHCDTTCEPFQNSFDVEAGKYLLGNSLEVVFTPCGEVLKIVGCEDIAALLCSKMVTSAGKEAIKTLWNESRQKVDFSNLLHVYSQEPVELNKSWKNSYPLSVIPEAVVNRISKLKSSKDAPFEIATVEEGSLKTRKGNFLGLKCATDLKFKGKGSILIDSDTGWILNKKHIYSYSGNIEFTLNGVLLKPFSKGTISLSTESTKL